MGMRVADKYTKRSEITLATRSSHIQNALLNVFREQQMKIGSS